ncbi:hypothetical protein TWF696_007873 [Orbilia brochopaga]|uniref:Sld7 C-terminal domain-containing protein n=1 Tax=Orbilia brochopaga TaxID=3140254 RepID=A0AAV9ULE4_9PEZI
MTTLWRGDISLPDSLPESSLESIELLSHVPATAQSHTSIAGPESDQLFGGAQLRVHTVVDGAKVPLWLSCGPSFNVQTASEVTANFFANIFVQQSTKSTSPDGSDDEDDEETVECQPTRRAIVVKVLYDAPPEETEKPNITELVLYGTLTKVAPSPSLDSQTPDAATAFSLSVYALPLSSRLAKEQKLHAAVKSEPLEPGKARFLVPIIGRKRKAGTIFDEYDKKQAYYASLPPGLRRSWHRRSDSFNSLKDEPDGGDSQKTLLSKSVGPAASNDFRRSVISTSTEDPLFKRDRERSQSVFQTRLREVAAADRPTTSRETSVKPLRGDNIFRRSDSFAGITRTSRNQTPDFNGTKSEFAASLPPVTITTTLPASKIIERNKAAATRLIMASMRLYGFQRARPGEVKIESEEEEYKTVFHATLRAVTCSLRHSWSTEVVTVTKLKETTEYLMKAFVGGAGLAHGSSDQEEELKEDDNPFRRGRIGRRSLGFGAASREDSLVGEGSFLVEESQPDDSFIFPADD